MPHPDDEQTHINFQEIENTEQLESAMTETLFMLHHIISVHWEVAPDTAEEFTDTLWEIMKMFADTYHRLVLEGKIPPERQLKAVEGPHRELKHD